MKDRSNTLEMISKVKKYQKKAEKCRKKARKILEKAQELCTHPDTVEKSSYFSGNYNDHAMTTYRTYCSVCGKEVSVRLVEHSWFG